MSNISENTVNSCKERAKALVSKMTLEEKVSQMLHNAPAIERLGIKAYNWWNEGLHGVARAGTATVFPQAIGLAASFDTELLETVADAIATEGRAKFNAQQKYGDTDIYKGLTFWSPNVNIFRDPRWGRGHETYGEDPHLTARLGVSFIKGLQGGDENYMKSAACAKHYAVHSGPEHLRHSFDAAATKQDMAETYLPAFKACVTEGNVEAVMGAYNRTNGEPCCGSKTLLEDILRGEWSFDGHVVSDCWAIRDFHEYHRVTDNAVESAAMAVNNGCDLNCGIMFVHLVQAVRDGLVKEETIDTAVTRLFTTRMKLGMFDAPDKVPFNNIPYSVVDSEPMKDLNLKTSQETLVLLKNENNLLPLDKSKLKTVAVIGPNANNRRALVGNYEGTAARYVTILEGIQDYLAGSGARVLYSEGCHLYKDTMSSLSVKGDRLAEARAVCAEADVIVVCVGLDASLEGEEGDTGNEYGSGDKPHLNLPGLQEELLRIAHGTGKPVIALNLTGSAMALNFAEENIPAIVQCWYPGARGGEAAARLLFGEYSPSGKLPLTFYRTVEELPEFTDYSMANRTYRYMKNAALYPFGYGLTYSDYELSDVKACSGNITESGVTISARMKNTGKYELLETLQVYMRYESGTGHKPNHALKHFEKLRLAPGEARDVSIRLPYGAFALADENGNFQVNGGEYSVYVGCSAPDARSAGLTGKNPVRIGLKK
ncbi:MAG: glycoside hydrolase family 3 C-terminal domain-containing protein [Defluviitaleaceae bacterium]|nr:glycoside hydrolase family 3 C-terminal domain-containing protein [Defluviitaleaceae bacterium]MCL2836912.1 glycoside hydrolase family 3 C-terminal domain-containing protein [Defluviitaleaceae bacterium]